MTTRERAQRFLLPGCLIAITWAAVFGLRLAAPSDLADNDQPRPLAYASDIIVNGAWILQRDAEGKVTTKPPLHAWMIALTSLPQGEVTRLSAIMPSAVSMLGVALGVGWILMSTGRRDIALVGGLAVLLSPMGVKMTALVRTDALLTAMVFAAFAIGVAGGRHADVGTRCRWRVAFWLMLSVAVFTKGPIALLLCLPALLVRVPLEGSGRRRLLVTNTLSSLMVPGLIGAWFIGATIVGGREVYDVMVGYEIYAQTVYSNADPDRSFWESMGVRFEPILYLMTWFLPWSVLALLRGANMFRGRAREPRLAGYEWAFIWQLVIMLPIFIIASHKRSDHLAPLIPGISVLGALAFGRVRGWIGGTWYAVAIAALAVGGVAWVAYEHFGRADEPTVRLTRALDQAGHAMASRGIAADETVFVRTGILAQLPLRAKEPEFGSAEIGDAIVGRRYVLTHDEAAALAALSQAGFEGTTVESFGQEDVRVHLIEATPRR